MYFKAEMPNTLHCFCYLIENSNLDIVVEIVEIGVDSIGSY
jgi:hypothetical protein